MLQLAMTEREAGDRIMDEARSRLPKISESVTTLKMYLDSLKLARRQIELERELGVGALRSKSPAGRARGAERVREGGNIGGGSGSSRERGEGGGAGGERGGGVSRGVCGLEVRPSTCGAKRKVLTTRRRHRR